MDDRRANILGAVTKGFIATGEPVSSGWLFDHYNFGIRPAMIRLELDALQDEGYLEQPHHSAGRVPSNKGYEFFTKRILEEKTSVIAAPSRTGAPAHRDIQIFLDELSEELGILSVAADRARDMVYKAGLEALIERLDWESREELRLVIRDFAAVDKYLPDAAEKMENMGEGLQVFIGKKSPVTKSDTLSVVCGNYRVGGTMVSIFAIGPKRMDYEKVIGVFRNL